MSHNTTQAVDTQCRTYARQRKGRVPTGLVSLGRESVKSVRSVRQQPRRPHQSALKRTVLPTPTHASGPLSTTPAHSSDCYVCRLFPEHTVAHPLGRRTSGGLCAARKDTAPNDLHRKLGTSAGRGAVSVHRVTCHRAYDGATWCVGPDGHSLLPLRQWGRLRAPLATCAPLQ